MSKLIKMTEVVGAIALSEQGTYDIVIDDVTVLSKDDLGKFLNTQYHDWVCYCPFDDVPIADYFNVYIWQPFVHMNSHEWKRMYNALTEIYNPIENYDRNESSERTLDMGKTISMQTTTTSGGTTYNTTMTDKFNNTQQVDTTTYDNQNLRPQTKVTNGSVGDGDTHSHTGQDISQSTGSLSINNEQIDPSTDTFTSRIHGNIGVTTSQQMIESEVELRLKNNIQHIIIDSLINRYFWVGDSNDSDFV